MKFLQIDSLSQLKTDTGFWDNFIWQIAAAFVIGVGAVSYRKIVSFIKNYLDIKRAKRNLEINNYYELCQILLPILNDNKYIFQTYGPNSSAAHQEPLRTNMTLWHASRVEYIVPNNEKIKNLVEANKHFINRLHLPLYEKLLSHIFAFKTHVANPNFDYSNYQFPNEIEDVIKEECFNKNLQGSTFTSIVNWLKEKKEVNEIAGMALFGSAVFSTKHSDDVDIVLWLTISAPDDVINFDRVLTQFKKDFNFCFKKPLHVQVFTSEEHNRYELFLAANNYNYII
ncbi:hypothetical protein [Mucilaginibacter myungsuensis]|uniref:Uncharacterized protein n=1 Tax=Mucilaginibacter myungsuensis TaxID=649104 RepID=A0A929KVW6_9SPHI|nr:hypothetical protein [Mucilaginibacter myungsuensis]MBE9661682.1 hypothetical protein [Mucilaginibacter myungsuensis]MDN3597826.1 hypothetical protein [Mucilaginibacter myungsuensis]